MNARERQAACSIGRGPGMPHQRALRRVRGISLFESLGALAILAFGLLGTAKLLSELTYSSGVTQARAEAVRIAATRIEEMRNLVLFEQFAGLEDSALEVTGQSAQFLWTAGVTDAAGTRRRLQTRVAWTDARGLPQQVALDSDIAWASPVRSALLVGGGLTARPDPRGDARRGRRDEGYGPNAEGLRDHLQPNGWNAWVTAQMDDRTLLYQPAGGTTQLVDRDDGAVLLVLERGGAFATVAGHIYVAENGPDGGGLRLMEPATGVCRLFDPPDHLRPPVAGAPGYYARGYRCYLGAGWYGNIGVLRTRPIGVHEHICVGDPHVPAPQTDPAPTTTRHARLTAHRIYRGFRHTGQIDAYGERVYASAGIRAGQNLTNQDFLVVSVQGQAQDSDCRGPLLAALPNLLQEKEPTPFLGNAGHAVCLTEDRPEPFYACPSIWPAGSLPVRHSAVRYGGGTTAVATGTLARARAEGVG
jgi:hypothetical protein